MIMMMKCFAILASSLGTAAAGSLNVDNTNGKPATVTVYFIRHAESTWNEKKAKIKAKEIKKSLGGTGLFDNDVVDAPLTTKGIQQVSQLRDWWMCKNGQKTCGPCIKKALSCLLARKELEPKTHSGENADAAETGKPTSDKNDESATEACDSNAPTDLRAGNVIFGTSNLKRAIETLLIFIRAMKGAISRDSAAPKVHIVSALQELSLFGKDAKTSLLHGQVPFDGTYEDGLAKKYDGALQGYPQYGGPIVSFDGSDNFGEQNRVLKGNRFPSFCEWVHKEAKGDTPFVISGHSTWLMEFFVASFGGEGFGKDKAKDKQLNLAENILRMNGDAKKKLQLKLANASMIKFDLEVTPNQGGFFSKWWKGPVQCGVKPNSTQLIFGDWQVAGSCESSQEACGELKRLVEKTASPQSLQNTCPV